MSRARRAAVVALYALLFWIALPAGLWQAARRLDAALGWRAAPAPWAWGAVAAGLGLCAWAIAVLRREGGGLPVSALPPPRLARSGPYRMVRHPIYLGFNLALLGAGLALGSQALARFLAPAFLPAWMAYAALEERELVRRFGDRYRAYRRRAGMLPRVAIYGTAFLLLALRVVPVRVVGRGRIPRGGAVLLSNHACYIDFLFLLAAAAPRRICFAVTAEAYRRPLTRWLLGRGLSIPVRRYRADPAACREILEMLEAGHLVAIAPEGERAPLGRRQPALPGTAAILARLPWPIVPVGISGAYDVGPRWAGVLRRRPVTVRVGEPIDFEGRDPAEAIAAALAPLIDQDPQPVDLAGLVRHRLAAVLWRCPRCLSEEGWRPGDLCCDRCAARWSPTADGLLRGPAGTAQPLAEVAAAIWDADEPGPLVARATGWRERSVDGPPRPLAPLGRETLTVGGDGLRFGALVLPATAIRSVTVERADTLQVATAGAMWQFRLAAGSAFRLQLLLDRAAARAAPWPRRARP